MALKARNRMQLIVASGGGTITPDEDESWVVRNILCLASASDTYLTVYVGDRAIAKIRVAGKTGTHLPFPNVFNIADADAAPGTLFDWLRAAGVEMEIPVPSGKDLTIARFAEAGRVCVLYDVYDAADVAGDRVNGPDSRIQRYIHYAQATDAIELATVAVNASQIWTGGEAWPFDGSAVPLNTKFSILAILASPAAKGSGAANTGYTTHLQLIHDSKVLFDPDRVGIPMLGDIAVVATTVDYKAISSVLGMNTQTKPAPALVLPEPLEFGPGEKLTTNLITADAAATGILAAEVDVAYVLEREQTA